MINIEIIKTPAVIPAKIYQITVGISCCSCGKPVSIHVGNPWVIPLTIPPQFCSLLYMWRLQSSFYSMAVQRYKSTKDNTSVILISFCLDRFFFFFFFLYACYEP